MNPKTIRSPSAINALVVAWSLPFLIAAPSHAAPRPCDNLPVRITVYVEATTSLWGDQPDLADQFSASLQKKIDYFIFKPYHNLKDETRLPCSALVKYTLDRYGNFGGDVFGFKMSGPQVKVATLPASHLLFYGKENATAEMKRQFDQDIGQNFYPISQALQAIPIASSAQFENYWRFRLHPPSEQLGDGHFKLAFDRYLTEEYYYFVGNGHPIAQQDLEFVFTGYIAPAQNQVPLDGNTAIQNQFPKAELLSKPNWVYLQNPGLSPGPAPVGASASHP